jgi:hypothetical protein
MNDPTPPKAQADKKAKDKTDRLQAALKANIARRKAAHAPKPDPSEEK